MKCPECQANDSTCETMAERNERLMAEREALLAKYLTPVLQLVPDVEED